MNQDLFLIHSIYAATEGEGVFVGTPQIFIRYQGCSIGCLNCDSKETWDFDEEKTMSLEGVLNQVERVRPKLKRVSITGGDPLHPRFESGLFKLIKALKEQGYVVNLEASGTRVVHALFHEVDFISFDLKTPSTGVKGNLVGIEEMVQSFQGKCQIKAVVADEEDYIYVHRTRAQVDPNNLIPWCLTPEFSRGPEKAKRVIQNVLKLNYKHKGPFRVIAQQHKWTYGTDSLQI